VVAGATGSIGLDTVALTISFAIGAALPLLFFALAGQRSPSGSARFRRHQRRIRLIGGIVMLAFAVALVFNVPANCSGPSPLHTTHCGTVVASEEVRRSSTSAARSTIRTGTRTAEWRLAKGTGYQGILVG
jgi:hypothetical protein